MLRWYRGTRRYRVSITDIVNERAELTMQVALLHKRFFRGDKTVCTHRCKGNGHEWAYQVTEGTVRWEDAPRRLCRLINDELARMAIREGWRRKAPRLHLATKAL